MNDAGERRCIRARRQRGIEATRPDLDDDPRYSRNYFAKVDEASRKLLVLQQRLHGADAPEVIGTRALIERLDGMRASRPVAR